MYATSARRDREGEAMRVLCSTTPHLGHFLPMVPLAHALERRGHDVVVASEPGFAQSVQREGLRPVGVGRDLTVEDMLAVLPDIGSVAPADQDAYARPRIFVELRANNVVDDLRVLIEEWRPDLVVRESAELAAWALAERLGLPHVAAGVATPAAEWEAIAAPWIERLGQRVGIAGLRAEAMYRHALLVFEPAGFGDWADTPTARRYRPGANLAGGTREVDARLDTFDDAPLVYATLGTEFYDAGFMTAMLDAAACNGRNVVATVGRGNDPSSVAPDDGRALVVRWLAQDALLDRVDVVLCHGGAGTIAAPLVHGVPLVVVPRGADQFANAARVAALGAGIALPPEQQDVDGMATALATVLDDPSYRASARAVADATARLPGLDVAVDQLEALA
jgi:UDP:flavonoid glycosyltransferase YjiC (YdhE family)